MMKINIAQLKKELGKAQSFSFKTSAEELGLGKEQLSLSECVIVEGLITNKGMSFEVTGKISTHVKQCCSRCLEEMVTLLTAVFSEEYREADFKESGEVVDSEINYFKGDEIDITDLVRETLLLAEPIKPLCSESCRGLCSRCGVNLNLNTCGCNLVKVDPRLAVLEKLLSKD
ncbi:MAG: Large ribosomal subunit accumulation protein YceD [Firmicutes bacterium]|nr:Large ribosomal subunit accumulation protein YceD [Bacillota bacterium]